MPKSVLALGLDPVFVEVPGFSPELVRSFLESQLDRVRGLGYEVESCFVDTGATAESAVRRAIGSRTFDCVLLGAGLRAPEHVFLFERLVNVVHEHAPQARICFNTTPEDTAEAVQRWI
jgi:hypothetical protein